MIRRSGPVVLLGGSAVVTAGIGWLTLVGVGRIFGPQTYAEFVVWWAFYFAATSVLVGLQQEVARSQLSGSGVGATRRERLRELAWLTIPLGLLAWLALLRLLSHFGWATAMALLPVAFAAVFCLVIASETLGLLIAEGRWGTLSAVTVADAVLRLGFVLACTALWPSPGGYVGGLLASLVVFAPLWRRGYWRFGGVARFGGRGFVTRTAHTMAGAGCLGLLAVGVPALIELTGSGPATLTAPLYAAFLLFRSPILLGSSALRPLVLRRYAEDPDARPPTPALLIAGVAVSVVVAAAVSWAVGPALTELVFGSEFRSARNVAAVVCASGVLLGALTMWSTVLIGLGHERRALLGWLIAVVVTLGVLVLPVPFGVRTGAALLAGPSGGLAAYVVMSWVSDRTGRRTGAEPGVATHAQEQDPAS